MSMLDITLRETLCISWFTLESRPLSPPGEGWEYRKRSAVYSIISAYVYFPFSTPEVRSYVLKIGDINETNKNYLRDCHKDRHRKLIASRIRS